MYGNVFDTDWESLTFEEAARRMYALGVAAALGDSVPVERRRIERLADEEYVSNLLQVAYDEGQRDAGAIDGVEEYTAAVAEGPSLDAAASDAADGPTEAEDADDSTPEPAPGAPDAVRVPSLLREEPDDLERVRMPEFLRRDDD